MLDTLPPKMERVPLDKPVLGVIWEGERPQSYLKDVMHPPPFKEVVRAEARLRKLRLVMRTNITALGSFRLPFSAFFRWEFATTTPGAGY